ncbi:MAG TPA: FKBP-type peptidyl-prolyl cis-trans isomerase [Gemmatimonadaceae bacterium]|jgi:peptidylprolyl isomerase
MKRFFAAKRLLLLVGALSLAACLDVSGPGPSNPANETFASSLGIGNLNDTTVWKQTMYGDYYRDEVVGTGALLVLNDPTDSVYADFTGWLKDGTVFQPAVTNGALPAAGLIFGFLDGLVGMRIGGTRTVVMPSNNGFGTQQTGSIPENSTLIFRIKLDSFTGAPQ